MGCESYAEDHRRASQVNYRGPFKYDDTTTYTYLYMSLYIHTHTHIYIYTYTCTYKQRHDKLPSLDVTMCASNLVSDNRDVFATLSGGQPRSATCQAGHTNASSNVNPKLGR